MEFSSFPLFVEEVVIFVCLNISKITDNAMMLKVKKEVVAVAVVVPAVVGVILMGKFSESAAVHSQRYVFDGTTVFQLILGYFML